MSKLNNFGSKIIEKIKNNFIFIIFVVGLFGTLLIKYLKKEPTIEDVENYLKSSQFEKSLEKEIKDWQSKIELHCDQKRRAFLIDLPFARAQTCSQIVKTANRALLDFVISAAANKGAKRNDIEVLQNTPHIYFQQKIFWETCYIPKIFLDENNNLLPCK